jgi:hypothetical protein
MHWAPTGNFRIPNSAPFAKIVATAKPFSIHGFSIPSALMAGILPKAEE